MNLIEEVKDTIGSPMDSSKWIRLHQDSNVRRLLQNLRHKQLYWDTALPALVTHNVNRLLMVRTFINYLE